MEHKIALAERDIGKQPLTVAEARAILELRPLGELLNLRHELAKKRDWKNRLPSLEEAARAIAQDAKVLRRPILVAEGNVLVGFDADAYRQALSLRGD